MPPSLKNCRFVEGTDYEVSATGCWLWLGQMDPAGYGLTSDYRRHGGERRAARAAYAEAHGPITKGNHVHHKCKTPACINPEHLKQLTPREHFLLHKLTEQTGLTLDDIRDIRQLGRTAGVRAKDVAERYGIHEITVFNYWGKEQVWADLLNEPAEPCRPVKTCPVCGVEFSHRYRNAVYCSVKHRDLANRPRAAAHKREMRRAA